MSDAAMKTSAQSVTITLPDGSTRTYDAGVTGMRIA